MANFLTPVDITPAPNTGWQTVDLSASIPLGATGVYIRARSTANVVIGGARHPSVTAAFTNTIAANAYQFMLAGVNASRQVQLHKTDGSTAYELIAVLGSEFVPLTAAPLLTVTAGTTWQTVSVASLTGTDTATGLAVWMGGANVAGFGGIRHPSSTDGFIGGNSSPGFIGPAATWFCGCDGSEQVQIYLLNTSYSIPVIGYFRSGFTWNVDAINRGPATAGSYQTLTAFASGNTSAMYLIRGENNAMVRRVGDTFDAPAVYDYQQWIVEGDASRQVQANVANTATDVFELGALAASSFVVPPTIDAPTSMAQGDAITATLTNAPAGSRSINLISGAVSIAQTVAGTDGSATFTANFERAAPLTSIARGVTATARVTNTSNSLTADDTFTTTSPAGQTHVTLTSINNTSAYRISSVADIVVGDQLQFRGVGGDALPNGFEAYADGTVGFTGGYPALPFEVRILDSTDSTLGDWVTLTIGETVLVTIGPASRRRRKFKAPTRRNLVR